ncbi:hypothetical protein SAMN04488137_2088 [Fictibacillus solisalsi]|uniref:DUF4190 domain-containing protein n=1 Tax=Fictibacillus solisalsi TaxID=459525 RepID=A0A1G9WD22_9BACL|nr:hypothetical protein [Fictibacillus solisalsi]SDM82163.1 hypothetical protein SAMN04488137_2088 [Fictibacillus solisalsi]
MAENKEFESEYRQEPVNRDPDYREEMAADVVPITSGTALREYERPQDNSEIHERRKGQETREDQGQTGRVIGMFSVILSVLSLFILPVLFGAAGIIGGFVAVRRGAATSGYWAIGIGIASIVISLLFAPFF